MPYRIDWLSTSQWAGTQHTEVEGEDIFETKEEAEAALAKMQSDSKLMSDVHEAAVQGQGVEGWLEVVEAN